MGRKSSRSRGSIAVLSIIALVLASLNAPAAQADDVVGRSQPTVSAAATEYQVTIAARECPTYSDIMANRARNNIMESLEDLGNDSNYSGGAQVNPTNETAGSSGQGACTPLVGWNFKLGTGIGGKDTSATYGSLSKVSNPYSTSVVTESSVPLLDAQGQSTGQSLAGATTIELTADQIQKAQSRGLWLQGGVPGSPLNGQTDKAFGALRCAIDNYNGDNVEWIGYPSGATHVFCYAFYVNTTPASSTIIIRKAVTGPSPSSEAFGFGGNISFNPDGVFSLEDQQSATFVRQAGATWTVVEDPPVGGFTLSDITCTGSGYTVDIPNRTVDIVPTAGSTVDCTFTNQGPVPTGKLDIRKISEGSVGTFGFAVTGQGGPYLQTAVTTAQGVNVLATGDDTSALPVPNSYTVTESLPSATAAGSWTPEGVECFNTNGDPISTTTTAPTNFTINLTEDSVCFVTNTFTPAGRIIIRSKQVAPGGFRHVSADSSYVVEDAIGVTRTQTATNAGYGSFVTADPDSGPDATTDLAFIGYSINGIAPVDPPDGKWSIKSLSCDAGSPVVDLANSYVDLTLEESEPTVTCDFVWQLTLTPPEPQIPNQCATPLNQPRRIGRTKLIGCQGETNVGKIRWRLRCAPTSRDVTAARGDLAWCRMIRGAHGRIYIRTYGYGITVVLIGSVPAAPGYLAWHKRYRWKIA